MDSPQNPSQSYPSEATPPVSAVLQSRELDGTTHTPRPSATTLLDPIVVLFRTCGHLEPDGHTWSLPIHAWVYQPTCSGRVQRATLALFRRYVRYKTKAPVNDIFQQRTQAFFVGNQRGRRLRVQVGSREFFIEKTGANGHSRTLIKVGGDELRDIFIDADKGGGWVPFQVTVPNHEGVVFAGRTLCVPRRGLSIVSDIDDTIKHSHVRDRRELLANTFHREFYPVPEIAAVYQSFANRGAHFHYVSSSPWQLHDPLIDFLKAEGFPEGSLHLRFFSLRNSRLLSRFMFRPETKARSITALLQQYPQRRFVLVGDSGERDPEIYGAVARRFPNQVRQIFIRDITGHSPHARRYRRAFRGTDVARWRVYRDAQELSDQIQLEE